MLQSVLRRLPGPAVLAMILASCLSQAALAQSPDVLTPDKLKGIVTGLGYEVQDGKAISINTTGKYVLNIILIPSDDQSNLYLYINLGTLTGEQAARQATKLLEFNSEHKEYFSFKSAEQNGEIIYLNAQIRSQAVSPQALRVAIDDLKYEAENFDTLWNAALWK